MAFSQTTFLLKQVLLLHLLCSIITTSTSAASDTHFQILNVNESIKGSRTDHAKMSQYNELFERHNNISSSNTSSDEARWKLELVHRDKMSSSSNTTNNMHYHRHQHSFHARMQRDVKRVATLNAGCHAGRCRYEVSYGDGSYTKGTLALETLTIGRTVVKNVAIGCGHKNQGMFVGAAGLLGLGGGSMSLVGQLGGQTGGAFSYCLVSRGTGSSGSLVFGREALPVGAAWVPLVRNPRAPSFYYVGLSGLGVGGMRIPISEDLFRLTQMGDDGVVMDTGTAVTRLPTPAYEAFRDAFVAQAGNLPRASGVSIFDTCYNLSGFVSVRVPTVSFYFSGGPVLTLPASNFLIPVDDAGTFCFAFAPSPSGLSIIGNIQQEGIQISFDGANGFVGFGPNRGRQQSSKIGIR
ncbi:hypothetical protein CUMW_101040 [Citrus unshiu]|nr:hypothetical protein CUMW_101040 [Citrus unshiu]